MPGGADPVQDHPGDLYFGVVAGQTGHHCGVGKAGVGGVDHQHDRGGGEPGDLGAGAGTGAEAPVE